MSSRHACPGGCGAKVPNDKFACLVDWYRLPVDLRQPISATARLSILNDERAEIVADAIQWYAEHPR